MCRADSLEKTLVLGNTEGRRRRGWQRIWVGWQHWLNEYEFEQTLGDSEGQGSLVCCSYGIAMSQTRLGHWTTAAFCFARAVASAERGLPAATDLSSGLQVSEPPGRDSGVSINERWCRGDPQREHESGQQGPARGRQASGGHLWLEEREWITTERGDKACSSPQKHCLLVRPSPIRQPSTLCGLQSCWGRVSAEPQLCPCLCRVLYIVGRGQGSQRESLGFPRRRLINLWKPHIFSSLKT